MVGVVTASQGHAMLAAHAIDADFGTLSAEAPDRVALVDDTTTLTYAALDARADRIAAALQRDGVLPGQAVSICGAASVDYAALFIGILRAGAAVAPLAPSSTADGLAAMIADCEAKLLFIDAEVAAALHGRALPPTYALDDHDAWLTPPGTRPAPAAIAPEMPFNIIYSSGTTGTPKGIVQSHRMRWPHAQGMKLGYGPDTVSLLSTPLYSNTTLVCFVPTLANGGAVVLMRKFDVGGYLERAVRHGVTHTMLVPVQYRRLMEHPEFDAHDLSRFVMKFCTSAPFAAELKADVLRRWPGGLVEFFGMTEGGGSCTLVAHQFPDKLHTVGRPSPGCDIRLIGEDGVEVASGAIGEIVGRSQSMMNGYHGRPDATAAATWTSPDGHSFIRTGDVGRFDDDGFLTLMDRKKDMIISGGFNIYPSDIEAVVAAHADVAEVAVVGVASDRWGETPVAFIVSRGADADTLRDWANARLGKTQRLASVVLVDALPRSAIGKVLKRELRDGYSPLPPSRERVE